MKRSLFLAGLAPIILGACAGSASHDVLSTHQANDDGLSCQELNSEITKAQMVIDGVNKDKDDLTAADITDGILWFPFNLIAKHGNYKDAVEAADRRIAHLSGLKKERSCPVVAGDENRASDAIEKLTQLKKLHKEGALTDQEFEDAKQKLLSQI